MNGIVYFITTPDRPLVKIGFTRNNPASRLRELQTGSPLVLCIIGTEPGSIDLERRLHERFDEHRIHGEWFIMHEEVNEYIREVNRRAYAEAERDGVLAPKWVRLFHAMENGASIEAADAA